MMVRQTAAAVVSLDIEMMRARQKFLALLTWQRFATSAACTAPAWWLVSLTIAVIYNFP